MLFLPRGKVRLQTSCMQRLPKILPLVGLVKPKLEQINLGHGAQYYTAPYYRAYTIPFGSQLCTKHMVMFLAFVVGCRLKITGACTWRKMCQLWCTQGDFLPEQWKNRRSPAQPCVTPGQHPFQTAPAPQVCPALHAAVAPPQHLLPPAQRAAERVWQYRMLTATHASPNTLLKAHSNKTYLLPCNRSLHISFITSFSCLHARCVRRQAAGGGYPNPSLYNLPDPSKIQSAVGTVLSISTGPRQPGPLRTCEV